MEVSVFPDKAVQPFKSQFVEARLHADTKVEVLKKRIDGLVETVAKSSAQPIYVAMDPTTEVEINRFNGSTLGAPAVFGSFLEDMAKELGH